MGNTLTQAKAPGESRNGFSHGTAQWHGTMARHNGTAQWRAAHATLYLCDEIQSKNIESKIIKEVRRNWYGENGNRNSNADGSA
jgi:hypothetical protein